MQLTEIKMAGFKSFVDPTTVKLPSKRIAVVGPNGCGKSNIIDAVTWVMGESSPKYLRGEALTDVIFNGSTARKPIGQASVELIFDNSDGSLGGEYAKFAEISIKRLINRDSDSSYYLNGVRCRKRDMVDLFLGTGLGPRSYSIIGQNMISRVIEAKPDELRTYLEEAAGISKYKERRHETELRIQHTKENLARVNDIRTELEKQLNHLKHQANVAEKFKALKQQERSTRAELYGIQWRQLDSRIVESTLQIQREETSLEARHSELSTADRELEQMRHEQRVAHDAFQEVQRRYYAVGNEITRIEQDILHQQERQHQWENDLAQTENQCQTIKNEISESDDELREFERETLSLEPQLATAVKEMDILQSNLELAEDAQQDWQERWDTFHQTSATTTQTAQVEKTNIQHWEQRIAALQNRQTQLQQDQVNFNFSELNKELEDFTKKAYEIADELAFQNKQLAEIRAEMNAQKTAQQDANKQLDNVRNELQKLRGQQASLEALQQTALGQRDNPATPWVTKHQLADKTRLAQHITVETGWELAAEKVLGFCLQAICVDQLNEVVPHLEDFTSGKLCVFTPAQTPVVDKQTKGTLLQQKIKSAWPMDALLTGIYVADSLSEALSLCESLAANESVVTRDGIWLNRAWIKILREEDPAAGVFQREQELKQLAMRIQSQIEIQNELEKGIAQHREKIQKLEQEQERLQQNYNQCQSQSAQVNAQQKMKQERLLELKGQSERCIKELEEGANQLKQANDKLQQSRQIWQEAMTALEQQADMRDQLIVERDEVRQQLQTERDQLNHKKQQQHELEIRLQTTKSQKSALQQTLTRLQAQMTALNERKITLQSELSSMPPLETLKKSLSRTLDKHVAIEAELNTARVAMESL
ncbi:MAG TPA: chromosome segregation protein SMC, partial [Gammaproteobacteria bacterium]|nr:chromosome segregation protein SMC [Gammaproteobacteria bacterium]